MEFQILSRSDFENATPAQVAEYNEFVTRAVSLICHVAPEYIIPCQMCRDAKALGAMIGTMSENGEIKLFEVDDEGGDIPHGNA